LNFIQFLQKYDFDRIFKELTLEQKYAMTLNQEDFEKRALLEMLEFASN